MISVFLWFLLCILVLVVLFKKTIKNKKVRKMIIVFFGILFVIVVLSVKVIMGFVPLPMGMRHLAHLMFIPKDLYQPVVKDSFPFYEEGFSKTYLLKPKYLDFYVVGFLSEDQNILAQDIFKGKIKAEFFWKDKLLFEKIATSQIAAQYMGTDMKYYKEVFLMDFGIPLQNKYKDDISIRLTVLESHESMRKYGDAIKLFIGVSSIP